MMRVLRIVTLMVFAGSAAGLGLTVAAVGEPVVFQTDEGVAIRGYDPVAYFHEGKPVKGDPAHTVAYEGATWQFASAENRELFAADPGKYAPAYGGYCAYGMAKGGKVPIDPAAWKIVDGTLYLNVNKKVQGWWEADIPTFIAEADANWVDLKNK